MRVAGAMWRHDVIGVRGVMRLAIEISVAKFTTSRIQRGTLTVHKYHQNGDIKIHYRCGITFHIMSSFMKYSYFNQLPITLSVGHLAYSSVTL